METQTTQSPGAELGRGIAYVALTVVIVGCLVYALVIDQSGKNIGAFGIAFAAFVGLIAMLGRGHVNVKAHNTFDDPHRPNVNPATGLPMNGLVDSDGNFSGSGRRYS